MCLLGSIGTCLFVQFKFVKIEVSKIFDGMIFYILHWFLYAWNGNMENFELGNGRMVDDPCDSSSNREKGGP